MIIPSRHVYIWSRGLQCGGRSPFQVRRGLGITGGIECLTLYATYAIREDHQTTNWPSVMPDAETACGYLESMEFRSIVYPPGAVGGSIQRYRAWPDYDHEQAAPRDVTGSGIPEGTAAGMFWPRRLTYLGLWDSPTGPLQWGPRQCSGWDWDASVEDGYGTYLEDVYYCTAFKSKHRYLASDGIGFFARCDLRAVDFSGNPGWPPPNNVTNFQHRNSNGVGLHNVTLISEYEFAANQWITTPTIEPPESFGSVSDGWLGQVILSCDFETPEDWQTRTGISISGA